MFKWGTIPLFSFQTDMLRQRWIFNNIISLKDNHLFVNMFVWLLAGYISLSVPVVRVRVASIPREPSIRRGVRIEDDHVARAVRPGQKPRAQLRPLHGRLHDERLWRRRERRRLLLADRVHGGRAGPAARRRGAPAVRRPATSVAGWTARPRAAPERQRVPDGGRAHRVRQGAHTQVPMDGRRQRQN